MATSSSFLLVRSSLIDTSRWSVSLVNNLGLVLIDTSRWSVSLGNNLGLVFFFLWFKESKIHFLDDHCRIYNAITTIVDATHTVRRAIEIPSAASLFFTAKLERSASQY